MASILFPRFVQNFTLRKYHKKWKLVLDFAGKLIYNVEDNITFHKIRKAIVYGQH